MQNYEKTFKAQREIEVFFLNSLKNCSLAIVFDINLHFFLFYCASSGRSSQAPTV